MAQQQERRWRSRGAWRSRAASRLARAPWPTIGLEPTPPELRVECFDISHTAGEATQASCVVFHHHEMQNSEYRRYNIQGITPAMTMPPCARRSRGATRSWSSRKRGRRGRAGTTAANRAHRRWQRSRWRGRCSKNSASISACWSAWRRREPQGRVGNAGLCRWPRRTGTGPGSAALMLVAQIRDEAHRFAITGMRARAVPKRVPPPGWRKSEGVGARRQKLLTRFGGLRGVVAASVDELASVEGISRALAEEIYRQLH